MKISTKAALLSAFVFPGVGHLYLKKHSRGVALIIASCAAIYYVMSLAVEKALQISEMVQSGDLPLDVEAITELVSRQSTGNEYLLVNIATVAFIICWLIGIIDSYRLGCVRDKKDEVPVDK